MKCPRTGTDLKEIEIDGVKIDISESCGGVWFDNFERREIRQCRQGDWGRAGRVTC